MGGIKKPSGKKLPSGYAFVVQPNIQGLAFVQHGAREPSIMFGTIACPMDKILPAFATMSGINDLLYEKFFETINCEDRLWLSVSWEGKRNELFAVKGLSSDE